MSSSKDGEGHPPPYGRMEGKGKKKKAKGRAVNDTPPVTVTPTNEAGEEGASSGAPGVAMDSGAEGASSWNSEQPQQQQQYYPNPGYVTAAPTVGPPGMAPPTTMTSAQLPVVSDTTMLMYSPHLPGQQIIHIVGEGGGTYMMPLNYASPPFGFPQQGGQQMHAAYGGDSRSPSFVHMGPSPPPSHPDQQYYDRRRGRGRGGHWKGRHPRRENNGPQQYMFHCQQPPAPMPVPNFYQGYGYPENIQYPIQQLVEPVITAAPEPGSPLVVQTAHGSMHLYRAPPPAVPPADSPEMEHHDYEQTAEMTQNGDNPSDGSTPPVQQHDDGLIYYSMDAVNCQDGYGFQVQSSYESIPLPVLVSNIELETQAAAKDLNGVGDHVEKADITLYEEGEINGEQRPTDSSERIVVISVDKEADFRNEKVSITDAGSEVGSPLPNSAGAGGANSCSLPAIVCNVVETRSRGTGEVIHRRMTPTTENVEKRFTGQWHAASRNTHATRPASANHRVATSNVDNHVRHNNIIDFKPEKGIAQDKFRAKPAVTTPNASTVSPRKVNIEGKGRASGHNSTWKPAAPGARFNNAPVVSLNASNRPRNTGPVSNRNSSTEGPSSSVPKKSVPDKSAEPSIDDFPQLLSNGTKTNASSKQIQLPASEPSGSSQSSSIGRSWANIASGQYQFPVGADNVDTKQTSDSGSDAVQMIDKGSGDSAVPGLEIWRGGR